MAKRISKSSINWKDIEKLVPPDQKGKYFAFKGKSDAYLRRVQSNPPEPPKIDWAHYQKIVPIPGLVDKLKSEYEGFTVPYPQDTLTSKVDEQWAQLQGEIKSFCAQRQTEIDAAQKELDKIRALPKFDEMTMEMVYDMFPDTALDPVRRPSFWPHNPEEQPGYLTAEQKAMKAGH